MPSDFQARHASLFPTVLEKDDVKQKTWHNKYQITNFEIPSKIDTENHKKLQEHTFSETTNTGILKRPITPFTNYNCQVTAKSNQTKLFLEDGTHQSSIDDVTTKVCSPELHKNQTKSFKHNSKRYLGPQQKCRRDIPFEDSIRHKCKRKKSSSLNEIVDKHSLEQQIISSNGTIFSDNHFARL